MKFYDITYDNACDSRNSAVIQIFIPRPKNLPSDFNFDINFHRSEERKFGR